MALQNVAVFPQEIKTGLAVTTAAIANGTGLTPTNTVELFTADASDGSIVTSLSAIPRETAAGNVLAVYRSKDGGSTKHLMTQKAVAADTVSTTDPAATVDFGFTTSAPLFLEAGEKLFVGQMVANPTSGYVWQCQARSM